MFNYYYYSKSLTLKNAGKRIALYVSVSALMGTGFGIYLSNNKVSATSQEDMIVMINDHEKQSFNDSVFIDYLRSINIKFPEIVYAQAVLETGNFKSKIFNTNNNLFGMKEATKRPTMAKGTELEHAYYDNWKESVIDYALYQARYLSSIRSESQYYEYLEANYAEDPEYINKIKNVTNRLKS
jgi:uncharacterized FlgJ-related protein